MPESWKITLPCTRAEAEILAEQELASKISADMDLSIVTREVDAAQPDAWAIDIIRGHKTDKGSAGPPEKTLSIGCRWEYQT